MKGGALVLGEGRPANAYKEFGFHDMEHEFLIKK